MSGVKRKRSGDAQMLAVYRPFRAPYKKRKKSRPFVPGRDRRGGYYGRFAGAGGELKFHDVDLDDGVVAAGGNVTATVNIIPQGTGENQRIGRKCTIKQINWKYIYFMPEADNVADPTIPDQLRIIMYVDKQCNGATAANTDILETNDFQSFRNLANSGRFQILLDKAVQCNYNVMASTTNDTVSMGAHQWGGSFYKKCNIPLEFNGTDGTIDEIRSNNIGVMLVGQIGSVGFASKIRLRFSDN